MAAHGATLRALGSWTSPILSSALGTGDGNGGFFGCLECPKATLPVLGLDEELRLEFSTRRDLHVEEAGFCSGGAQRLDVDGLSHAGFAGSASAVRGVQPALRQVKKVFVISKASSGERPQPGVRAAPCPAGDELAGSRML